MSDKWDEEMERLIQKDVDDVIKAIGAHLDKEIKELFDKKIEADDEVLHND